MHLELAHRLWKELLRPDDLAVDMTVGNGYDTLVLAELLPEGKVVGFDIQEQAIEATRKRVAGHSVQLIHGSHTQLKDLTLPCPPRLIVYNLGYLPGGNKSITTMTETTLESLDTALRLLSADGALSVMCYPGHDEGKREYEAVLQWVKVLQGVEVKHHPGAGRSPSLVWVRKSDSFRSELFHGKI